MNCLGCLFIFLLIAGPTVLALILKLGLKMVTGFVGKVGQIAVWLWQSFLNYFRRDKVEVLNPFTGLSNFDEIRQTDDLTYTPTETPEKVYSPSDGEYVDFTEL